MSWIEILGFATGALCVLLVVRRNVWNFPVGMANNVVFIVLFMGAGLYADAGLQVVYIGLAIIGWTWWLRGRRGDGTLIVRRATPKLLVASAVAVVVITAILYWLLNSYTDSTVAVWDALTTGLSLVAQWLLNGRYIENWVLWITADLLYIGLFAAKDLWLTSALYVLFLGLCVAGLRSWQRASVVDDRPLTSPRPQVVA